MDLGWINTNLCYIFIQSDRCWISRQKQGRLWLCLSSDSLKTRKYRNHHFEVCRSIWLPHHPGQLSPQAGRHWSLDTRYSTVSLVCPSITRHGRPARGTWLRTVHFIHCNVFYLQSVSTFFMYVYWQYVLCKSCQDFLITFTWLNVYFTLCVLC